MKMTQSNTSHSQPGAVAVEQLSRSERRRGGAHLPALPDDDSLRLLAAAGMGWDGMGWDGGFGVAVGWTVAVED